ncbi:MAG TPA: GGDEF domain-containing protein, partial [Accumulibacter sp.]|nr:GGDEF domain-containing protein [Accumulibacter sp.]
IQMCDRLAGVFRDTDYLVRWGGEEFLVVARATVADQPFELDDGSLLAKTCSIGFCCFPLATQYPGALGWSAVVNIADAALYVVKSSGRNGWLGALDARSESAEALLGWSRRPLADWARAGDLNVVWSPEHSGLAAALGARRRHWETR